MTAVAIPLGSLEEHGGTCLPDQYQRLTRAWLKWQQELRTFVRRRTPDQHVDDIVQDTWLRLRERSDPTNWQNPRAVIFTTARNLAVDRARRSRVSSGVVDGQDSREVDPPDSLDIAKRLEQLEGLERIAVALDRVPQRCRDAFLLNRLDGWSHADIAQCLGVSTKSVQRYIERALKSCLDASDLRAAEARGGRSRCAGKQGR